MAYFKMSVCCMYRKKLNLSEYVYFWYRYCYICSSTLRTFELPLVKVYSSEYSSPNKQRLVSNKIVSLMACLGYNVYMYMDGSVTSLVYGQFYIHVGYSVLCCPSSMCLETTRGYRYFLRSFNCHTIQIGWYIMIGHISEVYIHTIGRLYLQPIATAICRNLTVSIDFEHMDNGFYPLSVLLAT